MSSRHHPSIRRLAVIAAVAAGLLIGVGPPLSAAAATPESASAPERATQRNRISFAPGTSSASVGGVVDRGDWHEWIFRASAGQTLSLSLTSVAGNATFRVYTPSGGFVAKDITSFSGVLPATGDYLIEVGSTGGTTSYTLNVSVTGTPTPPAPPPPTLPSDSGSGGRIRIPAGSTSTSVDGVVNRGNWHEFNFLAGAGQTLSLSLSSVAANATFRVYTPSGNFVAKDVSSFSGTLPERGFYMIEVGSTGGTADYTLTLGLTGTSTPAPTPSPTPTTPTTPPTPAPPADSGSGGRIQIGSAPVSGVVVRGNWHEFNFQATAGQTVNLSLSSVAGNATFRVYTPSGNFVVKDVSSFSGALPESGFYMIEVGSAAGTAQYTLSVTG